MSSTLTVKGNTSLGGVPGPNNVVTTLAGSGSPTFADGIGSAASFKNPSFATIDTDGNIYVADTLNHRIRKVTATGVVTTLAGSGSPTFADATGVAASFDQPYGIAMGPDGNIYVADTFNNRIRKVTSTGVVTTLAGSGSATFADATGAAASFNYPYGIAIGPDGNIYVADTLNHRIRKVTATGVVTTVAGNGSATFADGIGAVASFNQPYGIAVAPDGSIYVADTFNHRIRRVTPAGVVRTIAGSGSAAFSDGTGTGSSFYRPKGIAIGLDGNIYVADTQTNRIRKVTLSGVVTTVAGSGTPGFSDGTGSGASFSYPAGVAVGPDGIIYVIDTENNRIRKIDSGLASVNIRGNTYVTNDISVLGGVNMNRDLVVNGNTHLMGGVNTYGTLSAQGDIQTSGVFRGDGSGLSNINLTNLDLTGLNIPTSGTTGTPLSSNPTFSNVTVLSNLFVPFIYNSSLRTSSIMASTIIASSITASTIATSTLSAYSIIAGTFIGDGSGLTGITTSGITLSSNPTFSNATLLSNLFVPFIYNSSLRTSSIMASTIIASSITASTIATSTLSAYSMIVQGDIQTTSGKFIGDGSLLTNLPNSGTTLSSNPTFSNATLLSNLFVPFIYNSSLQTSSIMASTIIASSITASTIATSTLSAYSIIAGTFIGDGSGLTGITTSGITLSSNPTFSNATLLSNLFVPFIYNSSLRTSSIMASTIIASSITASTIATSTLSAYSMIVQSNIQTLGKFIGDGSALTNLPNSGTTTSINPSFSNIIVSSNLTAPFITTTSIGGTLSPNNVVTTLVSITSSPPFQPRGISMGPDGNIYFTGNNLIRKVTTTGTVTTLAGSGGEFNTPYDIAVAPDGNIYVADTLNNRIRKVTPLGVVTTLAGSGSFAFADGIGEAASFIQPFCLALAPDGNLYVGDVGNYRIRKIDISSSNVTTLAGSGSSAFADGTGAAASFSAPVGIAVDTNGNIYISDNHRIRKVTTPGAVVTTLAGNTGAPGFADGNGVNARFNGIIGIDVGPDGNIYVVEEQGNRIRKVTPNGEVTILAGDINSGLGFINGTGTDVRFNRPRGCTIAQDGIMYIADTNNNAIRKTGVGFSGVNFRGDIQTTGTFIGDGSGLSNLPTSGTTLSSNPTFSNVTVLSNLFVPFIYNSSLQTSSIMASTIIASSITASTIATSTLSAYSIIAGTFIGDGSGLTGITTSGTTLSSNPTFSNVTVLSNLFVPFIYNSSLRTSSIMASTIIASSITASTIATSTLSAYSMIVQSNIQTLGKFIGDGSALTNLPTSGTTGTTTSINPSFSNIIVNSNLTAPFITTISVGGGIAPNNVVTTINTAVTPYSIAMGPDGNIYIGQPFAIRKVTPAGAVTTLAGSGTNGFADGIGTSASFFYVAGIAVAPDGSIYVADQLNHIIRKVSFPGGTTDTNQGVVTTIAGGGGTSASGYIDAVGEAARFNNIYGIAIGVDGNIYAADGGNRRIRKIETSNSNVTTFAGDNVMIGGNGRMQDGVGTGASFSMPLGITVDPDGNFYISDASAIRKMTSLGAVTTIAGGIFGDNSRTEGAVGTNARLARPIGLSVGPDGNIYVAEDQAGRVSKVTPSGVVTTLAGSIFNDNLVDGTGSNVRFKQPSGVAIAVDGTMYIADYGNSRIRKTGTGFASVDFRGTVNVYGTNNNMFAGNVGIGKANPTSPLDVSGNITASGNINASGTVTSSSDIRIKTNIVKIDSPLEKISNMRGVYYNRIDDSNANPARHVGVIAQEIESVFPEVVSTDNSEEKNKSVAYGNIVALLIEAVKAQQSTIDSLLNR
jgi:sugar lactone lactonase YvrE/3D (Asp-Asp-Asp) domain-containing protein